MAHLSIKKIMQTYLWGLIITSGFFITLYLIFPSLRHHIIASNEILDIVTATLFCLTFIMGLYNIRFIPHQKYQSIYFLIPVIAFIGFFSEVRLGFHPLVKEHLFQLGIQNWTQLIVIMSILFTICAALLFQRFHLFTDWITSNIPTLIFLTGFVLFFMMSILLDTQNMWGRRSIVFVEELCELNMALSLLFSVIHPYTIANKDAKNL